MGSIASRSRSRADAEDDAEEAGPPPPPPGPDPLLPEADIPDPEELRAKKGPF